MKTLCSILICILFTVFSLYGQNLQNNDLEGTIAGYNSLPSGWSSINSSDINCLADPDATSPDLMDNDQPGDDENGMIGTPYSGNTFMGGSYGGTENGPFFHEGIKQNVSGFIVGEEYDLSFYQSIVKTYYCSDTSGSWLVVLDDDIIGVSEPSVSLEPYNSTLTNWDYRTITFTASQSSHELKFLPFDDDENQVAIIDDENGCVYAGIDLINIQLTTPNGTLEHQLRSNAHLYPSSSYGDFTINLGATYNQVKVSIIDMSGNLILVNSYKNQQFIDVRMNQPSGVYAVKVESGSESSVFKFVKN